MTSLSRFFQSHTIRISVRSVCRLSSNKIRLQKYQSLVESCFCRNCLVQMCVQAQPAGDENAWRRNRLKIELKVTLINRSNFYRLYSVL